MDAARLGYGMRRTDLDVLVWIKWLLAFCDMEESSSHFFWMQTTGSCSLLSERNVEGELVITTLSKTKTSRLVSCHCHFFKSPATVRVSEFRLSGALPWRCTRNNGQETMNGGSHYWSRPSVHRPLPLTVFFWGVASTTCAIILYLYSGRCGAEWHHCFCVQRHLEYSCKSDEEGDEDREVEVDQDMTETRNKDGCHVQAGVILDDDWIKATCSCSYFLLIYSFNLHYQWQNDAEAWCNFCSFIKEM